MKSDFSGPAEIERVLHNIDARYPDHINDFYGERSIEIKRKAWQSTEEFWERFRPDQQRHLYLRFAQILQHDTLDRLSHVRDGMEDCFSPAGFVSESSPRTTDATFPNGREIEAVLRSIARKCNCGTDGSPGTDWERLFSREQREVVFNKLLELFPWDRNPSIEERKK